MTITKLIVRHMDFEPKFEAVIFDLDGVITKTALVHACSMEKDV